jgi:hypothetical protein
MEPRQPWYRSSALIVLLLISFYPVGVFLMWKGASWSKRTKMIISIPLSLFTLLVVFGVILNASGYKRSEAVTQHPSLTRSDSPENSDGTVPTEKKVRGKRDTAGKDVLIAAKEAACEAVVACEKAGNITQRHCCV